MDVPIARSKSLRRLALPAAGLAALAGVLLWAAGWRPLVPRVPRSDFVFASVRRGDLVHRIRVFGTLVATDVSSVAAAVSGRVKRIASPPGSVVDEESVVVELENDALSQAVVKKRTEVGTEEATLTELQASAERQAADQEVELFKANSDLKHARLQLETDASLAAEGLTPRITLEKSRLIAEDAAQRVAIEERRLAATARALAAQTRAQRGRVERVREELRETEQANAALIVRARARGVVQQLSLERGQVVESGALLGRVARPDRFKAVVKVPETDGSLLKVGQTATVATPNGTAQAEVARISPAAEAGTISVDLCLNREWNSCPSSKHRPLHRPRRPVRIATGDSAAQFLRRRAPSCAGRIDSVPRKSPLRRFLRR